MSTDLVAQPSPLNALLADTDKLRDFPIATVERMLAMQTELAETAARQAFAEAMLLVQREVEPVVANARNPETGSVYAKLDAVSRTLDPVMLEHGFTVSFSQGEGAADGLIRHEMKLRHIGGHHETHHQDLPPDGVGAKGNPIGKMNRVQAVGSSDSYGARYLKLGVFNIQVVTDDDGRAGGKSPERITDRQASELQAMLDEAGGQAAFLEVFSVRDVRELHPAAHKAALTMLRSKLRRAT